MNRNTLMGYISLVFLCGVLVHGYSNNKLSKGPFCAKANNCCENTKDRCPRNNSNGTCYCDRYCLRYGFNDCCPDYIEVCLRDKLQCHYEGYVVRLFEEFPYTCNDCKCILLDSNPTVECTKKTCLIDLNQINTINNDNLTWTAMSYSTFWGQPLKNAKFWLGTANPRDLSKYFHRLKTRTTGRKLPNNFIAQTYEKNISIVNQGPCQSSFEHSFLDVLRDRDYIGLGYSAHNVQFPDINRYCNKTGKAEISLGEVWKSLWNSGSLRYRPFHRATRVNIMHEIYKSGPVQATMKVFQDFFVYKQGIYQHKVVPGEQPLGWHSVRVLGWDEKLINGRKYQYWIAANSWGEQWGEEGLFKILIDRNECEFELHVMAS